LEPRNLPQRLGFRRRYDSLSSFFGISRWLWLFSLPRPCMVLRRLVLRLVRLCCDRLLPDFLGIS